MKIVFVSGNVASGPPSPPPPPDTAPDRDLMRNGLAARGITIETVPATPFPLHPMARLGSFYAGFDPWRALRLALRHRDVDAIIGIGESSLACVLPIARALRFPGAVLLREIPAPGWPRRDRIVDYVLPRVDGVLALTPRQASWAAARWPLRSPPDMVGFAIDEGFFRPQPAENGGYVLAVGDDFGRDYGCLIEACRLSSWRLVLRTDSKPEIPEEIRDRVTLVGRLPFVELRALYAAAAAVAVPLQPVESPTGITALFEGMAMGRPVVATDTGATRHILRHGENGLLVPPGDPAALAAALRRLVDDPGLAERCGRAARVSIEDGLTYDAYVDRLAAALRRHVAQRWTAG
jgi:glycosyltransferase involved in cell wall biosynthesis